VLSSAGVLWVQKLHPSQLPFSKKLQGARVAELSSKVKVPRTSQLGRLTYAVNNVYTLLLHSKKVCVCAYMYVRFLEGKAITLQERK